MMNQLRNIGKCSKLEYLHAGITAGSKRRLISEKIYCKYYFLCIITLRNGGGNIFTLTVSQLNRYIKAVLEEDKKLSDLYIRGEVSNFTYHTRSGHFYFSLKDDSGSIKAVMFKSYSSALPFVPENGMMVLVRASVGVYERDGVYQLYVTDMQPDGAGALALAFEQLKLRLSKEGLFDEGYKKSLPLYPKTVGVITSESGAAFHDIVNIISRRYPIAKILFSPALVQGRDAENSLIRSLSTLDGKCDVIIIGRGGGSAEDLFCFNGEKLARAVFKAITPVISAVGHETDYTICDFVADVRAPTPSAAAELAVPSVDILGKRLSAFDERLRRSARQKLREWQESLDEAASHPVLEKPTGFLEKKKEKLDFLSQSLYNNKNIFMENCASQISRRAVLLDSLSPLHVLKRGYGAVFMHKEPVASIRALKTGDKISIRLHDGTVRACITETEANMAD